MVRRHMSCGLTKDLHLLIIFVHLDQNVMYIYQNKKRKKWSSKSVPGLLVGYCDERDGYRVYVAHRDVTSKDVIFKPSNSSQERDIKVEGTEKTNDAISVVKPCVSIKFNKDDEDNNIDEVQSEGQANDNDVTVHENDGEVGRPQRQHKTPSYLNDYVLLTEAGPTYKETVTSPEWWH